MEGEHIIGKSSFRTSSVQDTEVPNLGRVCILILGMHRSGTSALTRVINIAGAKLPNCIIGAGVGNELGHWEPARLAAYHDELLFELDSKWNDWRKIDWSRLSGSRRDRIKQEIARHLENDYGNEELIVLKEPRICRIAPFFLEVLNEAGYDVRVIMPLRNPLEIADSLRKRGDSRPAETMHFHSSLLWLRHVLDAEAATRSLPRSIISYDSLLSNWRGTLAYLSQQLNVNWPNSPDEIQTQVQSFLAAERRHHRYSTEELYRHQDAFGWLTQTYETMLTLRHNPYSTNSLKTLDQIRERFDEAESILRGLIHENTRAYETQIQAYETQIKQINENQLLAYEKQIEDLRDVLNALQHKVERRKKRQRRIRAVLSNPAKYLWEKSSNKQGRVGR